MADEKKLLLEAKYTNKISFLNREKNMLIGLFHDGVRGTNLSCV